VTICSRALIGGFLIFLFCKWKKFDFNVQTGDKKSIWLSGLLLGLHWITYFYALKLSNVAIGMISIFTFPVITALLEPIILKTKFELIHLALGALVIVGILFLVPTFDFQDDYLIAIILGIVSALFYSLRNIITKSQVNKYNGSILMFYQLLAISVFLSPSYFFFESFNFSSFIFELILLAVLATAIGQTLFLYSFKNFTVTSASIISSLQPVYGIIIGMVFLKEYPVSGTIVGGLLILLSVVLESIITYKRSLLNNKKIATG
jgi:drug/metabolite transporter (DMT)-like permease